jgi:Protein of unknown function (DUF3592)
MPRIEPISTTASGRRRGCATVLFVGFLGLFVVAGCAIGYFLSARPLYSAYQARAWTPTACEVISSQIVHGDETSRPDIVYRYEIGGRQYTANRYNFIPGSTSDSTVPDAVASHPPGAKFECYVDPGDPSRAVINRMPTLWYYMGLPFFVMFAGIPSAVGLAWLYSSRHARSAERGLAGTQVPGVGDGQFAYAPSEADSGPIVLRPSSSPLAKLLTMTFICVFWNGIVGAATYFEYRSFTEGDSIWVLAVFLLLFQIVGVGLIAAVPYQILALANPRPTITLSAGSVPLGGSVSFAWELSGAAHRVTRLQMMLRGREEARYRRGTDTKTDTHVFFSDTLIDATDLMSIARGSGTIRIPDDSMHTFDAGNNKVIWTLHVTGAIARWPDIDESFDIMVRPV